MGLEQSVCAHLWACAGGGLTHAEDRLVLDAVQPADSQTRAADPGHHGDVAVSEAQNETRVWKTGGKS